MKILVINGSPRNSYSVTLHTSLFLEKVFKEHEFEYLNVGNIRIFEKSFDTARKSIEEADLVIFSYPVYTFVVPSQLHRFIELLKEQNIDLSNKFATQISTSKHFYDVAAANLIEDNCHDLGFKVIKGLAADMEDLTTEKGREEAINFFKFVIYSVNNNIFEPRKIFKTKEITSYISSISPVTKSGDKNIVIVADLKEDDTNLKNLIDDFIAATKHNVKIINIHEFNFSGGCLGCFNCATTGKCIYKDGFDTLLRDEIQTNDAIVIAFTIKDHSMGSRFKMYDDRQFCNGHRTVTEGMPFAYIINGDYESEFNLKTVVEARAEVGGNYLAGVGLDKDSILTTVEKLEYALDNKFHKPRNFYGVGGMKIFRDLICVMRGLMKADHEYYKKHGVYDFPHKQRGKMLLMCLLGSLIRNSKIKAKMDNKFNEGMVMPYKKVLEKYKDK